MDKAGLVPYPCIVSAASLTIHYTKCFFGSPMMHHSGVHYGASRYPTLSVYLAHLRCTNAV